MNVTCTCKNSKHCSGCAILNAYSATAAAVLIVSLSCWYKLNNIGIAALTISLVAWSRNLHCFTFQIQWWITCDEECPRMFLIISSTEATERTTTEVRTTLMLLIFTCVGSMAIFTCCSVVVFFSSCDKINQTRFCKLILLRYLTRISL